MDWEVDETSCDLGNRRTARILLPVYIRRGSFLLFLFPHLTKRADDVRASTHSEAKAETTPSPKSSCGNYYIHFL